MSELIDISVTLDEKLPTWPGSPGFRTEPIQRMETGAESNLTQLTCDVHTGTHVDAPRHFVSDGATVARIPLGVLVGPAFVAEVPNEVDTITARILDSLNIPEGTERLLLHTSNSKLWHSHAGSFQHDYVALAPGAAEWIVDHDIHCVGIDHLSVQHYDDGPDTHQILLREEVIIVEGLDLSGVDAGRYELICMPIKLDGSDGAPARVALRPHQ